jgi:alpha-galactosidase
MVYAERLVDDSLKGVYWSCDGVNTYYDRWATSDAFELSILTDPQQKEPTKVDKNWRLVWTGEVGKDADSVCHYVMELVNTKDPVRLKIHTVLDGTSVMTRWLEIGNTLDKPIALATVCPWMGNTWPYPDKYILGYMQASGVPADEAKFTWEELANGTRVVKCTKGLDFDDPFFVVQNKPKQQYLICHLAWTPNWEMQFDVNPSFSFRAGPAAVNPQRVIGPGEWVTTPAMHLGFIKGSFDNAVQAMHEHIRLIKPKANLNKSGRIQYLIPGDHALSPFNNSEFNAENLKKCVDVAHAVGAEVFIIDCGWWKTYGHWYGDPKRFPKGIEELSDYIHNKGMDIGLYIEAEGARGNIEECATYKAHPDWFWGKIVEMTNPQAAAWVESESRRVITDYKLDIFRMDYNPIWTNEGPSTLRSGFMENNHWRQYEAEYAMFERLTKDFPDTVFQQASGGGARSDLGIAGRLHESYISDLGAIPKGLRIISAQTVSLPPEGLVTANGGQGVDVDFETRLRMIYCLMTPQFFETYTPFDVKDISQDLQNRFLHYSNIYKNFIRPVLPESKVYHHAPVSDIGSRDTGPWFAMEYTDQKATRAWALIVKLEDANENVYHFVPRGLDISRKYKVTFDNYAKTVKLDGWDLMANGLNIPLKGTYSSELILFEAFLSKNQAKHEE